MRKIKSDRTECCIEGCTRKSFEPRTFFYCSKHRTSTYRYHFVDNDVLDKIQWKINISGYKYFNYNNLLILEHRERYANKIGRLLASDESVHHINGNKLDNRVENLELWLTGQPKGQRVDDKLLYALDILKRYDPDFLET